MQDQQTALVVIDAQVGPLFGTYKKDETLNIIQKMIGKAERENIPIFYIQHEGESGGLMERGTPFWKFAVGIIPRKADIIIHKQFADAFYQTSLRNDLKRRGVSTLVVVGVRTEYCVDSTCRSAIALGFDVTLVEDGHTTADGVISAASIIQHHNRTLSNTFAKERRIAVKMSNDVFSQLANGNMQEL
ncbi:cysteine hydrolase family protein [Brevibacillus centrosporus]|uniref:cysteine hydrolase family protein n=1 Tax=Brevibacillus centrosporus TaxID=54910 RepID=UPI003985B7E4